MNLVKNSPIPGTMSQITTDRLIFHETPASLQTTASIALAALVWRHEINQHTTFRTLEVAYPKVESLLAIPSSIGKLINRWIEPMKKSFHLWLEIHHLRIFFPYRKKYTILKDYFDLISWDSDGIANDVKTTKKMLSCPDLDPMYKFKLACSYCFEDDIRMLWPQLQFDIDILNVTFRSNSLFKYWYAVLTAEDNKKPIVTDGTTETSMILQKEHDNSSALVYLWSRLKPDDQIDKAVFIVENCPRREIEALFRSLTKPQFKKVIKRCYKDILLALVNSPRNVEFGLQTWHYMRALVTPEGFYKMIKTILDSNLDVNCQHMRSILESINRGIPNSEIFDQDAINNVSVASFLHDIWLDAPDKMKNYVINNHVDEILSKLCEKDVYVVTKLSRDVRLIILLLSQRSCHQNNSFWRKHWSDLIKGVRPETIDQLMKLCFRNDREISNFKKSNFTNFSKISDYCNTLISDGNFDELNEFLSYCSPDRSVRAGLKRKIIWNPEGTIRYCCYYIEDEEKMRAFDNFISDISPDIEKRKNFKCQIITSIENFRMLESFIVCGFIRHVKKLVCSFVTRPDDLKVIKRKLKQHCQSFLKQCEFRTFDVNDLNDFIMWCVNDDQKQLDQIKQSIPVESAFDVLFQKCVIKIEQYFMSKKDEDKDDDDEYTDDDYTDDDDEYTEDDEDEDDDGWEDASEEESDNALVGCDRPNSGCTCSCGHSELHEIIEDDDDDDADPVYYFTTLDNFLSWYFADEEKVKEFKLNKIRVDGAKDNSAFFRVLVSENKHHKRITDIVLRWFFNQDAEKVKAYKATGTV